MLPKQSHSYSRSLSWWFLFYIIILDMTNELHSSIFDYLFYNSVWLSKSKCRSAKHYLQMRFHRLKCLLRNWSFRLVTLKKKKFGHAYSMQKFPSQKLSLCRSNDPSHSIDNTGSLTHWATRELLAGYIRIVSPYFFYYNYKYLNRGCYCSLPIWCSIYDAAAC